MSEMSEIFKLPEVQKLLFESAIGLEKENVRVWDDGHMATTPHPFGNKSKHPFIITDYSESQVEIGTEVCDNPDMVYDQLENLHDIVTTTVAVENGRREFLWPISNPPLFGSEADIPVAKYDEVNQEKERYREYLGRKYGKKIMLYSGIHYNFSFSDGLIRRVKQLIGFDGPDKYIKSNIYMKMAKNCYLYSWFPVYMTAASPIFHESFLDAGEPVGGGRFLGYASMRNSKYGYWNKKRLFLDYTDLDTYIDSIVGLVQQGELYSTAEFYTPVRLKPRGQYLMKNLRDNGVNHIELRMFDLNPLDKNGMAKADMELMEYFLFFLATQDDFTYNEKLQNQSLDNHMASAAYDPDASHIIYKGRETTVRRAALSTLDEMLDFYDNLGMKKAIDTLQIARVRAADPEKLYSHRIYEAIKKEGYIPFGIRCAEEALRKSNEQYYLLKGFEDLELSTQAVIKACLKLGVKYEVLDRPDNFLRLTREGHTEYVKQATKTSRDNCAAILLMRNKALTKRLLAEQGFPVPGGAVYTDRALAMEDFHLFAGKPCVVKPNFTNYGIGVTVFTEPPTRETFEKAVDIAFGKSEEILVEDYAPGQDYRFLVIGDEVQAVSKRMPASVVGDGVRDIKALILELSKDPLRGEGHRRPKAFIGMGAEEELYLQMHGMSFRTVPKAGGVVYLRQNSNVSTGGDAIDCTDFVHDSYKDLALRAAKAVGAVFCGVDIIARDVTQPLADGSCVITELNFNPSIKIHCYPTAGQGRPIGETVVRFLFDELDK
jgi:glutamate--cysteine ligase